MTTQTLKIEGMTCGGCVGSATRALREVPGVTDARVTLADGQAVVESAGKIDPALLTGAIEKEGFHATVIQ